MATDTERLDALGCSDTHCELRPEADVHISADGRIESVVTLAEGDEDDDW